MSVLIPWKEKEMEEKVVILVARRTPAKWRNDVHLGKNIWQREDLHWRVERCLRSCWVVLARFGDRPILGEEGGCVGG